MNFSAIALFQFPRSWRTITRVVTSMILLASGRVLGQQVKNADDALLISNTLMHIWPTGELQSNFVIIQTDIFRNLHLPCVFSHTFDVRFDGKISSKWDFPGLTTYLVPEGRDSLRWQPLSGLPVIFPKNKIERFFPSSSNSPYVIRQSAPQQYEIKSREGLIWKYQGGALTEIVIFNFGTVMVECQGSFLSSLKLAGESLSELEIKYDTDRKPVRIYNFGQLVGDFRWNAEQLRSWTDASGKTMSFSYDEHNLLSGIEYPGVDKVKIGWKENYQWQRGDSRWPSPMHLAQFKDELYDATLENRGFVIKISSVAKPDVAKEFCFNPLTHRAQIQIGSERHIIQFDH